MGSKPYPTATKETYALGFELGLEGIEGAPLLHDLINHLASRCCGTRCELSEVEVVVQDLSGVVENTARRLLDDFFQRKIFETAARQQFIQVIHVGLQVLAVVEFERLCANYWCQSVFGIGKVNQGKHISRV